MYEYDMTSKIDHEGTAIVKPWPEMFFYISATYWDYIKSNALLKQHQHSLTLILWVSKILEYIFFEYKVFAKQVFFSPWITISFHCLIHLLHNQKSCIIKVQVNLRLRTGKAIILHVIIVFYFAIAHYDFSYL